MRIIVFVLAYMGTNFQVIFQNRHCIILLCYTFILILSYTFMCKIYVTIYNTICPRSSKDPSLHLMYGNEKLHVVTFTVAARIEDYATPLFPCKISLRVIYAKDYTSPGLILAWKLVNTKGARHTSLASQAGVKRFSVVGITFKVENNKLVYRS